MTRLLSAGFGLLMVASAAIGADGVQRLVALLALGAVAAGLQFRVAATAAVLLTVAILTIGPTPPVFAALSGLSATAYLVLRHTRGGADAVVTMTRPTLLGMVGFTFVGLLATSVPLNVPWLPLLAPPAAVVIYLIALRPFVDEREPRD